MARLSRPETSTLLGAQLVFNIGFYAVVPFLTTALSGEYGMGAAAVGLVLGARTFSQQGMFLLGGMVADHWGAKRSILLGCLVRITGYLTLALAADFPGFLLGAVLTGAGGALFSPALESQLSTADDLDESQPRKRSVFVWLALTGEFGALVGPLLGAALMGWGFDAALAFGSGIFAIVTVLLWLRLPSTPGGTSPEPLTRRNFAIPEAVRNRLFLGFCVLVSIKMVAYNQLYFTIPLALARLGLGERWLAGMFLMASVLTLLLQIPVSAAVRRLGEARAMSAGFSLQGISFLLAAGAGVVSGPSGDPFGSGAFAMMAVSVALLILGHMSLTPTILSVIPRFVPSEATGRGSYYGLAASCGGLAVLLANAALGLVQTLAGQSGWGAGASWLLLFAVSGIAAVAIPSVLPRRLPTGARP